MLLQSIADLSHQLQPIYNSTLHLSLQRGANLQVFVDDKPHTSVRGVAVQPIVKFSSGAAIGRKLTWHQLTLNEVENLTTVEGAAVEASGRVGKSRA